MERHRRTNQPTLADVARVAGVSTSTASRVLAGYGHASSVARKRVRAAATTLGYRPNALARSMITGQTNIIGLVVADIENPFFARAARGVSDVARAAGFEVVVANSDEDAQREAAAVRVLLSKRVDGLIVAPAVQDASASHLMDVIGDAVPLVFIDRGVDDVPADLVMIDNAAAARIAVQHLIDLGHRDIAIVTEADMDPPDLRGSGWRDLAEAPGAAAYPTSTHRLLGYLETLHRNGAPINPEFVRYASYDRSSAAQETASLMSSVPRPTAIFATDNLMTLGTFEALRARGVRIPTDVSLVGFDDLEWTALVDPPLTVVAQPVYELGATAAGALMERIVNNSTEPRLELLDTSFVVRASTRRVGEPNALSATT